MKELFIFNWISFLWIPYCKQICVIFNIIIFYGSEPLAFGAEASDSVLTGDDFTSPALTSPTLLQFGNGSLDGFNEVYVSKFRTKYLRHANMSIKITFSQPSQYLENNLVVESYILGLFFNNSFNYIWSLCLTIIQAVFERTIPALLSDSS